LVGEIAGQFFVLGTNFLGQAPTAGELKLYYWDANNFDNTEEIRVTVAAVPEPASALAVLAFGAVAAGGALKKKQSA
jgi:hypothetical protein